MLIFVYVYMHLADALIQSDIQYKNTKLKAKSTWLQIYNARNKRRSISSI